MKKQRIGYNLAIIGSVVLVTIGSVIPHDSSLFPDFLQHPAKMVMVVKVFSLLSAMLLFSQATLSKRISELEERSLDGKSFHS